MRHRLGVWLARKTVGTTSPPSKSPGDSGQHARPWMDGRNERADGRDGRAGKTGRRKERKEPNPASLPTKSMLSGDDEKLNDDNNHNVEVRNT